MVFHQLKLDGVYEIIQDPIEDSRGFFLRTYDLDQFKENGLHREWVQENHSKTTQKGTIRGLHFQFPPYTEAKLVRCIKGALLNVFVDLRKESKTFGKWDSIELSEENKKMIFIPRGFANGFCILKDNSELIYKSDNYYNSAHEGQLLWNDKDININWPIVDPILSEKDKYNMTLECFKKEHKYLSI